MDICCGERSASFGTPPGDSGRFGVIQGDSGSPSRSPDRSEPRFRQGQANASIQAESRLQSLASVVELVLDWVWSLGRGS